MSTKRKRNSFRRKDKSYTVLWAPPVYPPMRPSVAALYTNTTLLAPEWVWEEVINRDIWQTYRLKFHANQQASSLSVPGQPSPVDIPKNWYFV